MKIVFPTWNEAKCLQFINRLAEVHCVPRKEMSKALLNRMGEAWSAAMHEASKGSLIGIVGVLTAPLIAGHPKKQVDSLGSFTTANIARFVNGHWNALFNVVRLIERRDQSVNTTGAINKAVETGNLKKVSRLLDSNGVRPNTPETVEKIKEKLPNGPDLPLPPSFPVLPRPATLLEIEESLNQFTDHDSSGPFSTFPRLFRLMWRLSSGSFRHGLRSFINGYLAGKLHPSAAPFLACGNLTPLAKGDSDLRPIIITPFLRRLAGRVANRILGPQIAEQLAPLQLAVGVKAGCEKIVFACREKFNMMSNTPDAVSIKVDIRSAYPELKPAPMLTNIGREAPGLFPFASYSYSCRSFVFCGSTRIPVHCGPLQGEPTATAMFCLNLKPIIKQVDETYPLDMHVWWADDGHLIGHADVVAAALKLFEELARPLGWVVTGKTTGMFLYSRDDVLDLDEEPGPPPPTAADFERWKALFPAHVQWVTEQKILGVILGPGRPSPYSPSLLADTLRFLDAALSLEDQQMEYELLSECGVFSRLVYLMRCCPRDQLEELLTALDVEERKRIERHLGTSLTDTQMLEVQLKKSRGGLGIRNVTDHQEAAYIGCQAQLRSTPLLERIMRLDPGTRLPRMALQAHIDSFNERVRPQDRIRDAAELNVQKHAQKKLSKRVDDRKYERVLGAYQQSEAHLARLHSKRSHNAQAHLSRPRSILSSSAAAMPKMSSSEFREAQLHGLGVDQRRGATHCPFPHDAPELLGALSEHAVRCKNAGGAYKAHRALSDFLQETATRAGVSAEREPPDLIPGSQERPADVLLRNFGGATLAVDVTVVDTLQTRTLYAASVTAGAAARQKESLKEAKYAARLSHNNIQFDAFAIETYGFIGNRARSLLDDLAFRIARKEEEPIAKIKNALFYGLQTIIKQQVAQRILARIPPSGADTTVRIR